MVDTHKLWFPSPCEPGLPSNLAGCSPPISGSDSLKLWGQESEKPPGIKGKQVTVNDVCQEPRRQTGYVYHRTATFSILPPSLPLCLANSSSSFRYLLSPLPPSFWNSPDQTVSPQVQGPHPLCVSLSPQHCLGPGILWVLNKCSVRGSPTLGSKRAHAF